MTAQHKFPVSFRRITYMSRQRKVMSIRVLTILKQHAGAQPKLVFRYDGRIGKKGNSFGAASRKTSRPTTS
jgi:hypothetical protein